MKLLKYLIPALFVGLFIAGSVSALSVSLPALVKKGDLLVGSSTNSSLFRLATSSQGSVLWMTSGGLPGWTATSTLGISGGGGTTPTIIGGGTATGPAFTFATTTDTNLLTQIVCGTSTCTFTPQWTGTLADGRIASAATWNAKQATISVTAPITLSGASIGVVNQGTTVQVLHGNASGNASFGSVVNGDIANSTIDLTAKVTGILPVINGGTNTTSLGNLTLTSSNLTFGSGDGKLIVVGTSTNITLAASPSFTNGTFTGTLSVTGTSTLATTTVTSFTATGIPTLSGVSNCNGSQFLQITTGLFGCGTPAGGGSGNSAWTIGNTLIYNATSTDSVLVGTSTPVTSNFLIQGTGTKNPFTVSSSSGTSLFTVNSDNSVLFQNEVMPTVLNKKFFEVVGSQSLGAARIVRDIGNNVLANSYYISYDVTAYSATSTIDWPDNTGVAQSFSIATGTMQNIIGTIGAARVGNDTTGSFFIHPFTNGVEDSATFTLSGNTANTTYTLEGVPGASIVLNVASSSNSNLLTILGNGKTGISSSSPTATLVVQSLSAQSYPVLNVASSTGVSMFQLDTNGLVTFQPTATSTTALLFKNPSGQNVISVDTTSIAGTPSANILTVATSTGANLFNINGFGNGFINGILFASSTAPTIATSTGAGTASTATLTGGNQSGEVTVNALTSPATSAVIVTITPSANVKATNKLICTFSPSNNAAAALNSTTSVNATSTATTWGLVSGTAALTTGTTYKWFYNCGGY